MQNNLAVPNYEVKLLLKPELVLNSDKKPVKTLLTTFNMKESPDKMNVQYLDNKNLDMNNNGWLVRIRKKASKDGLELTYKKRYKVSNGDIKSVLEKAASEGFDAEEDDYDAQIDWGYNQQTLSFSDKKPVELSKYKNMELPNIKESRKVVINKIPDKINNYVHKDWGKEILESSKLYGPVSAERYEGKWKGIEIDFEVWKIKDKEGSGYEDIVEISFKVDSEETAGEKKKELITLLNENNKEWLIPKDKLKTQMILERYK